ncbi:hypothetical protein CPAV1605_497 [seawater metagenome]|uniref:Uncharacterized protein n=1 Tax=seawater metagenome TaxID=1561972 RepID=A0A5E8CLN0_9ZZZZ
MGKLGKRQLLCSDEGLCFNAKDAIQGVLVQEVRQRMVKSIYKSIETDKVEIAGDLTMDGTRSIKGKNAGDAQNVFSATTAKVTVGGGAVDLGASGSATSIKGTANVAGGFSARGYASSVPSMLVKYPSHTTDIGTGAQTLTIAQILTGIILCDPTAAATHTTPTAALTVAGVTGVAVGDTIDFHLLNTGTAGEDETITVAAGTGVTLVGFADVENSATTHDAFSVGSSHWRIRFTNVTSGSEAYTIYRLA